jgi:hypothetical protein
MKSKKKNRASKIFAVGLMLFAVLMAVGLSMPVSSASGETWYADAGGYQNGFSGQGGVMPVYAPGCSGMSAPQKPIQYRTTPATIVQPMQMAPAGAPYVMASAGGCSGMYGAQPMQAGCSGAAGTPREPIFGSIRRNMANRSAARQQAAVRGTAAACSGS